MRTCLLLSIVAAAALSLAACNPYDPDLGQTPFRCTPLDPAMPDEKRCPEGYKPVVAPAPVGCLCERPNPDGPDASMGGGPDGNGMFSCNADPNDPGGNENISMATPTTIGAGSSNWSLNDVAICPDGTDVDVYSMVLMSGAMVTVTLYFTEADGQLQLAVLNSGGTVVAQGTDAVNQANASYTVPASGTYYVRVQGPRNNYSLSIGIN